MRKWDICSVVKWHKVAHTTEGVVYVKEIIIKKPCRYGGYGLFEH